MLSCSAFLRSRQCCNIIMNHPGNPVQAVQIPQRNTSAEDNNQIQCWVPGCPSDADHFPRKMFYSLPGDPFLRDLWLAAAGKAYCHPLQNIWFCADHFSESKGISEKIPVCNMPQKICRTCLAPIQNQKYCVLSINVNSKMPECVGQIFGTGNSMPLIEVLRFCIPEMTIEMNPIPVCCDNCFRSVWLYYFFKKRFMYMEKALEEEFYPGKYGRLVGCRACPSSDYKNLVFPNEHCQLDSLLKSMLGNRSCTDTIPLQLCPTCITILKGILDFIKIFSRTQEFFKQLYRNPQQNQTVVEKPINKEDAAKKQLLLGELMLEKGLELKDQNISGTQQADIWNIIQKCFVGYGYTLSIQSLKDTWSTILLEYTLGRLKGTKLGDIISQYITSEYPKPSCKPLKKRYRVASTHLDDPSSSTHAAEQNATVHENIIPNRIYPEPIRIFEPNIIPPPSCSVTTLPPPYPAHVNTLPPPHPAQVTTLPPPYPARPACSLNESDATTVLCSPIVEPETAVNLAIENSAEYRTPLIFNDFMFNKGPTKLTENGKLKQSVRRDVQNKCPQAFSISASTSSLNSVAYPGIGQSIPQVPIVPRGLHSSTAISPGIEAVVPQRQNSGSTILDRVKPDPSKNQNFGNSCSTATSTISVTRSAIPTVDNPVIDLTEDEDKMVQVANITSSWEDTAGNAETQESDDMEFIEVSKKDEMKNADRPTDMHSTVIEDHRIDKVGVSSGANTIKAKKTATHKRTPKKGIRKPHQTFSFQDKVDLIDAIKCEYEVSKVKGVLSTNPWKKILNKLHQVMYDDWDENRLWRMWSQMRVSAKIHSKDGSDYVDAEVWNLLEKHNSYLKNRKNYQQNVKSATAVLPGTKSDVQQDLKEKSDKQDDKLPKASINSPPETVQTLISSYCKVENIDQNNFPTKAQLSSSCAEQTNPKSHSVKESVMLEANPSQPKVDKVSIEIDSYDIDVNNDSRCPAAKVTAPSNPVKTWTESEKSTFIKSVKVEFGTMLKNNENISNPWKTIIERLHKSQYSMHSLKELDKAWRKIRMDAHLHENNNAWFVTPLDMEVNRLIKLLHTIKEAKRTSKLKNNKSAKRPKDKHDSEPKNTCTSNPAMPEKKKRKKRPLTLSKVKKDKKPKFALPPLDPNRLEEDKEGAEKTAWSEKEQRDLISIVETTGNEVFNTDFAKQFWSNVRTKMTEKGHSERSVGALYHKWNRLLESAKLAWADQKAVNSFDQAVIDFLTQLIRKHGKKKYDLEENEGMKDSTTSGISGDVTKNNQQSELHSVDQNKSDKVVTCEGSSVKIENSEQCTVQEIVKSEHDDEEMEDDGAESDEYVSAADILKM